MTILHNTPKKHQSEHDAFLAAFRERKAQFQRRYDAALRLEPLAHRPGDDRGFSMHWSN